MISSILATAAFLVALEGILIAFFKGDVRKFMGDLAKKRDAEKIIMKIGLWEILIGFLLLVLAIILRRM